MTIDKAKVQWDAPPIDPKQVKWEGEGSSTLPANAGLANLGASIVGLPVDALTGAYNLFKSGMGVAQHKLLGTEPPELTRGLPGSSESIRNALRSTGLPGLSPDNPQPQSKMGTAQYDFVSRGGAIPGAALPAAGSMIAEKIGGPKWAGVGALAPQVGITAFNALRAPVLAKQEAQNFTKDQTLRAGREEGYVVPPSSAQGGSIAKGFESLGGKAATQHQASIKNQQVTNRLAAKEIELPEGVNLTKGAIESQRRQFSAPYKEVSSLSPDAAKALEQLKQARADANGHFSHYNRSADPAALAKAKEAQAQATSLEEALEQAALSAGKPGLVADLRKARVKIAKTYTVERALNTSTGNIDASVWGRMVDKGKPISGGPETAGRFQQAFPKSMRPAEDVAGPGVSALSPYAGAALGMGGYASMGWPGLLAASLPFTRPVARAGLLSGPVQNRMMPNYGPGMTPAPAPQLLYQLGILQKPGDQ